VKLDRDASLAAVAEWEAIHGPIAPHELDDARRRYGDGQPTGGTNPD